MYTIFFDLETGGVLSGHPTIQLAAIVTDGSDNEVAAFETKITFDEASADPEALALNHYTREDWNGASTPIQAAAKFATFVRPYSSIQLVSKRTGRPYSVAKLAGYNALTFDLPRLKALFGTAFFPCSYLVRDVMQRVLFYFDERPSRTPPKDMKLSTVVEHFGISVAGAHDALADARATAAVARIVRG